MDRWSGTDDGPGGGTDGVGTRAAPRAWLPEQLDASPEVRSLVAGIRRLAGAELPEMGLAAGLRPAADVDELISGVAALEYQLARQMDAAARAAALPMPRPGGMCSRGTGRPGGRGG